MSECTHDCASCGESCSERQQPQSLLKEHHPDAHIGKVYGIVSGKGGVGKSMVTSQLAGHHAPPGPSGGHPGRRRHRPLHPQGLRHPRPGHGQRGRAVPP